MHFSCCQRCCPPTPSATYGALTGRDSPPDHRCCQLTCDPRHNGDARPGKGQGRSQLDAPMRCIEMRNQVMVGVIAKPRREIAEIFKIATKVPSNALIVRRRGPVIREFPVPVVGHGDALLRVTVPAARGGPITRDTGVESIRGHGSVGAIEAIRPAGFVSAAVSVRATGVLARAIGLARRAGILVFAGAFGVSALALRAFRPR